jgi:hypothetical protein
MFSVDVDGLRDLAADWNDALQVLSDGVRDGVRLAVKEGAEEARRLHRYKDRTGELTRRTEGRVIVSAPGGAVGEITAKKPYASFVEDGTKAHDIWPKAARGFVGPMRRGQSRGRRGPGNVRRFLRWVNESGVHFARMVRHPGSKPHPFMSFAYFKAERVILREVERAVALAQRILSR